jgi:uncharacterized coiled-coil DUF342 family protein
MEHIDREIMERERERTKMNAEIDGLKKREKEDCKKIDELDKEIDDFDGQLKDRNKEFDTLGIIWKKECAMKTAIVSSEFEKKEKICANLKEETGIAIKQKNQ